MLADALLIGRCHQNAAEKVRGIAGNYDLFKTRSLVVVGEGSKFLV